MARPKGSKNKTRIVNANVDYAAVVAEKTAEKEKIESEVAALTANLDDLKTQMKAKKAELKAVTKELTKAENKKAAAEAKAMEEAKKSEQQFIGLFHCKCGTSWQRDIGFFERTPDMVFSLERKKVRNKVKQLPTIHHK